jgi:hypothetical protein
VVGWLIILPTVFRRQNVLSTRHFVDDWLLNSVRNEQELRLLMNSWNTLQMYLVFRRYFLYLSLITRSSLSKFQQLTILRHYYQHSLKEILASSNAQQYWKADSYWFMTVVCILWIEIGQVPNTNIMKNEIVLLAAKIITKRVSSVRSHLTIYHDTRLEIPLWATVSFK